MNDLKNNFFLWAPIQVLEFLRVRLFVLIDSLLVSLYKFDAMDNYRSSSSLRSRPKAEEEELIITLCKAYCELYCKWLEQIPNCVVAVNKLACYNIKIII